MRTAGVLRPGLVVLAAYAVMRLVDVAAMSWVAAARGVPVLDVLLSWDSGWHIRVAEEGYPEAIGMDARGRPEQTTWAWPPIFPLLARALAAPLGPGAIGPVMIAVALLCGAAAAVVLMLALREPLGDRAAATVAVMWSALPGTSVLVMAYAEGLFALLAFGAVWAVVRGRFVAGSALLVVAGLTKTSVAPFAVALVVAAWWSRRSKARPAAGAAVVATALSAIAVVAWPAIVATRLGSLSAYATVQSAWGRSTIPFRDTVVWLLHPFQRGVADGVLALAAIAVALIAAVVVWRDRRFPLIVRLVGLLSPAFVLVTGAGTSTSRLLVTDIAVPGLGWRITRGLGSVVAVVGTLTVVRVLWVAVFVTGAVTDPPP